MKATAKITIQMGMLMMPHVKMYSAIERSEKLSFNQLHAECKCRVQQKMFCPTCHKDIIDKAAEIVKGYPLSKDSYVVLSETEIDSCKKESSDVCKVFQFVEPSEIDEIYFSSASFLAAEKEGMETFSLFYHLLTESGKMGLAKMVQRGKDNFLAIKPYNGVLVAYDLYFPNQIRGTGEIEKPIEANAFDQETVDLAMTLVKKLTKPFNPQAIKDEYSDSLRAIIKDKADGKVINVVEQKVVRKVISLKDALKGSLDLDEAANF